MADLEIVSCPVSNAHRRLETAHSFWHDALKNYGDPYEFERHLNSCLQEMRNFTFLLQKEISGNSEAEIWYEGWQGKFRANVLIGWLNDARVEVVHLKNLSLKSTSRVRIVSTYDEASDEVSRAISGAVDTSGHAKSSSLDFLVRPEDVPEEVFKEIISRGLPKSILQHATASIERTWIVDTLPDLELLSALSFCFGLFLQLMTEAHERFSDSIATCAISQTIVHPLHSLIHESLGNRPMCMVTSRLDRTQRISLLDGSVLLGEVEVPVVMTPDLERQIYERYGSPINTEPINGTGPIALIPHFLAQAKEYVRLGDQAELTAVLFKGEVMQILGLVTHDQADKRAIMQGLADKCAREGHDGILIVGETWMSKVADHADGGTISRTTAPKKREAVFVHAETKDGHMETVLAPISRNGTMEPSFGQEIRGSEGINFMGPIRAVWRMQ